MLKFKFWPFLFFLFWVFKPVGAVVYSIGSADITLHDASRNRDVPVKIYYPKTKEDRRFPVLIFSHGAGGSKDGYAYLGHYWASHGYVVLHPTHLGSDRSVLKGKRPFYNKRALRKMTHDKANLVNRPKDVSFLLDSLPELEERVPALKGLMDPTRVGVGGHSFGAYTSMAVAGAKVYGTSGGFEQFEDTRVIAFLALSPQGPGGYAFRDDSWGMIHRPVLMVTGTRDKGFENEDNYQWRLKAFEGLRPGHKYLAVINAANHMDFADAQLDGKIRDPRVHDWIQQASLLFWDAYVKGKRELQSSLKRDGFPQVKSVKVQWKAK